MNNNIYLNNLLNKINMKQSEFETLTNTISHYGKELDDKFMDILKQNNIDPSCVFEPQIKTSDSCNCNDHCTDNINNENNEINEYKQIFDTLYKQLAFKTHPDKSNDPSNKDFIDIADAYEKKDILKLINYANKYELFDNKLENLNVYIVTVILEKHLHKIKQNITKLKSTVGFNLLIKGNIDTYIETLKYSIRIKKENEELKNKINELNKMP